MKGEMKQLKSRHSIYPLIFLIFFACGSESPDMTKFDHQLFSIEYPSSWERIPEDGLILAISKYSKLNALAHSQNPNLIIVSQDSLYSVEFGMNTLEEFIQGFKENQTSKEHISLSEDTKSVIINGYELEVVKYEVKNYNMLFLQSQYSFSNMGHYVSIIITHEFGSTNHELQEILESLEIHSIEPIGTLFDDQL